MPDSQQILSVADAARALGLSPARIHQMDAQLRPVRTVGRGIRIYRKSDVERVKAEREAQLKK